MDGHRLVTPCGACGAHEYEAHDLTCTRQPDRGEMLAERVMKAFAAIVDAMFEIPPLSWLDAIVRGPVGPPE